MTRVDQFESIFRAAAHEVFTFDPPSIASVMVVTDQDAAASEAFAGVIRSFLSVLGDDVNWHVVDGSRFSSPPELVAIVEETTPDLVCTYRNLHTAWSSVSIGVHVEVLTQATASPVLLLPHPDRGEALGHALKNTDRVMAMTDHMVGDQHLVNFAARLTERSGRLFLTHIEDRSTFERFVNAISKIPSMDTDVARDELARHLLKEPEDYIKSCRQVLSEQSFAGSVESLVGFGDRLGEYRALIEEHEVDLLLFNTKDEDQIAMHGMIYPIIVQIRGIPMLLT